MPFLVLCWGHADTVPSHLELYFDNARPMKFPEVSVGPLLVPKSGIDL